MAAKGIEVALFITAYDKATAVINNFAKKAIPKLDEVSKKHDTMGDASFKRGKEFAAMGLAIGGPLIFATKKAIDFEDKMADVAKVMNFKVGGAEFNKMGEEAKRLAVLLGESAENAAGLMASLAQGGVEKQDLKEVAEIAGKMGVAFGMSADMAGEKFIKMKNALGTTIEQTRKVADSINFLADGTAADAAQIVTYMAGGGSSVAGSMRISGQASAAFGSALISLGKSGEESATIMQRFQKGIMNNPKVMAEFKKAGGGVEGMLKVLEHGSQLVGEKQYKYFARFGEYGSSIAQMAQNFEFTAKTVRSVANETQYASSVQKEFNNRSETSAVKLKQAKAAFENAAIGAGNAFLPVLIKVLGVVTPFLTKLSTWIDKHPKLTNMIVMSVAATSAFFFAVSGLNFAIGGFWKVLSFGSTIFKNFFKLQQLMSKGIFALRYGFLVFSQFFTGTLVPAVTGGFTAIGAAVGRATAFLMANPIILIITAIAIAALLIWKYWDQISAFFVRLWGNIKIGFNAIVNFVKKWGILFIGPVGLVIKYWDKIVIFIKSMAPRLFDAGKNIVKSIWDGMKTLINKPVEAIKNMAKKIRDFLPFSPAKEGALRDIHKIRLVETIADSVKPRPLINAMRTTTAAAMMAASTGMTPNALQASPAMGGNRGGGGVTISVHYNPQITIQGAGENSKEDFSKILEKNKKDLVRIITEEMRKIDRLKYSK